MDDVYDNSLVDLTYTTDGTWMMDDQEGWNVLQALLQNILEIFSKLEVSFEKSYQEVTQKNSSEGKMVSSTYFIIFYVFYGNKYNRSFIVTRKGTNVEMNTLIVII